MDDNCIEKIASLLSNAKEIHIVGCIDIWQTDYNGVCGIYNKLVTKLNDICTVTEKEAGEVPSVQYSAKIEADKLVIQHEL